MADAVADRPAHGAAAGPDGAGIDEAARDPSAFYADPDAILADADLTPAEQHRLLAQWAQDLADRQVAAAEGMAPDTAADEADEAVLLKRVRDALDRLGSGLADNGRSRARSPRREGR